MEHLESESAGGRQEWEEAVLRRWALTRATKNGAQFARDIGVGQASVSRFRTGGGARMSSNLRGAVEVYWRERGFDVDVAEAELLEVTGEETPGRPAASHTSPSLGDSGDDVDADSGVDAYEGAPAGPDAAVAMDTGTPTEGPATPDAGTELATTHSCPTGDAEPTPVKTGHTPADIGHSPPDTERQRLRRREPVGRSDDAEAAEISVEDGPADVARPNVETCGATEAVVGAAPSCEDTDTHTWAAPQDVDVTEHDVDAPVAREEDTALETDPDDDDAQEGGAPDINTDDMLDVAEDRVRPVDGDESMDTGQDEQSGAYGQDGAADEVATEVDAELPSFLEDAPPMPSTHEPHISVPVLSLLSPEAAVTGQAAVSRGWRWHQDPPPEGIHGDALFYLHTREDVAFEDEGALQVALAPDRHEFACGLTASEMRFGVHPRQRQKRYAVSNHLDRKLLIGERLAAVIPEVPYEDEDWFFGSEGITKPDGAWLPSAAELIARRRLLLTMEDAFSPTSDGMDSRPFPLHVKLALREVEITLLGVEYAMTFGEQVSGQRTWAPSTRLGIETDWRLLEMDTAQMIAGSLVTRVVRWIATGAALPLAPLQWMIRGAARRILKSRGLWDGIFDHPMRRAAMVVRSGQTPSRFAVRRYRILRSLAGVSPLTGQFSGSRDWTPAKPPWTEAYQLKYRPHHYVIDDVMHWLPSEFDQDYRPLPAARRAELAEGRERRAAERRERERKRQENERSQKAMQRERAARLRLTLLPFGVSLSMPAVFPSRLRLSTPFGIPIRLPFRRGKRRS